MSARMVVWALLASLLLPAAMGCGDHHGPTVPLDSDWIAVVGQVTSIDDGIPVDGDARIDLALDDGDTATLVYGSWFTSPPPSQEHVELYQVILQLKAGDRVRAVGTRSNHVITLKALEILEQARRPWAATGRLPRVGSSTSSPPARAHP